MKNKTFRGHLQQDAQEFLRSFLNQIHEELEFRVPDCDQSSSSTSSSSLHISTHPKSPGTGRNSTEPGGEEDISDDSSGSQTILVAKCVKESSSIVKHSPSSDTSQVRVDLDVKYYVHLGTLELEKDVSPTSVGEEKNGVPSPEEIEVQIVEIDEKAQQERSQQSHSDSKTSLTECGEVSSSYHLVSSSIPSTPTTRHKSTTPSSRKSHTYSDTPPHTHTPLQDSGRSSSRLSLIIPSLKVSDKGAKKMVPQLPPSRKPKNMTVTRSIVTDIFEGQIESSVTCLKCQQVSVLLCWHSSGVDVLIHAHTLHILY